ncbi:hypothetical protein GQR58_011003 [Nymphon striatum]|nr:hypothetical protein GQR58_011003 [Nymphon striatum]
MWPKNHRRNPPSGWDVAALAATAGASPAPSGRPHPTPPGYLQWYPPLPSPGHDIRNDPQRPLPRARRYRWLDPHLVTHSKRAVFETLNLRKVDVKRYTPSQPDANSHRQQDFPAPQGFPPASQDRSAGKPRTLPAHALLAPVSDYSESVEQDKESGQRLNARMHPQQRYHQPLRPRPFPMSSRLSTQSLYRAD